MKRTVRLDLKLSVEDLHIISMTLFETQNYNLKYNGDSRVSIHKKIDKALQNTEVKMKTER